MNALATAPGVIATPGKYYIGAQDLIIIQQRKMYMKNYLYPNMI